MKSHLQFDFHVDKVNNQIKINREFAANLEQVWKVWTTAELLDQWWGPEPWRAETKTMDFKEGGFWHYAMVSPEGERHWGRANYISIVKEKSFSARDCFCDENGTMNLEFPQNLWENRFNVSNNGVKVIVTLTFDNIEDLEKTLEIGFKEGFTAGLNQLDELLRTLEKSTN